jgi:hypothetical protein
MYDNTTPEQLDLSGIDDPVLPLRRLPPSVLDLEDADDLVAETGEWTSDVYRVGGTFEGCYDRRQ